MKIAWFTPFSTRSAIGRFSQIVVEQLLKHAQVDVWHSDSEFVRETEARQIFFKSASDVKTKQLDDYDLLVYNFGNHLPFHREIYHVSQKRPGVCILHDLVMHHFFASYFLEHIKNPVEYEALMKLTYGDPGTVIARQSQPRIWESDEVMAYPLFEPVIQGSYGVVTHSRFFRNRVESVFSGPVESINLAYDRDYNKPEFGRIDLGIRDKDILLLTVGHINRNKRINDVLEALCLVESNCPDLVYAVVGPIADDHRAELFAAAKRNGFGDRLRITGFVSDNMLSSYLSAADLCINLRQPTFEGASASVVEEMLHGKPVVVCDTGFYAELPDNCVVKVAVPLKTRELSSVLVNLIANPMHRTAIGSRALDFASKSFSAKQYADHFLRFAWKVGETKPLVELADTVGQVLGQIGVDESMEIVEIVTGTYASMFQV